MTRAAAVLLCLGLLFLLLPAAPARADKALAIAKIEKLLADGHLAEAKKMIDHLLEHNPDDKDLARLLESWRIRKGRLAELLSAEDLEKPEKRDELRGLCWQIVEATCAGNPEEWEALLRAGDEERALQLLARRDEGNEEEMRVAERLLDVPETMSGEEILAAFRKGPEEALAALRAAEDEGLEAAKPYAAAIFAKAGSLTLRIAAAAVLLCLEDESPRPFLEEKLHSPRPVLAVEAGKVLLRYPKDAKDAETVFARIRDDEKIGRAKPALLAMAISEIAASHERGALGFLTGLLESPAHRVDAARALGVLGDADAIPALLAYLRAPAPTGDDATSAGLDFLGKTAGGRHAAEAEAVRPALVGALSLLALTKE